MSWDSLNDHLMEYFDKVRNTLRRRLEDSVFYMTETVYDAVYELKQRSDEDIAQETILNIAHDNYRSISIGDFEVLL